MDKKEKLSFIKRQFQRFMRKKQEVAKTSSSAIKQFAYDYSGGLRRVFAGAFLLTTFSLSSQAKDEHSTPHNDSDIKRKLEINDKYARINTNLTSTYIADAVEFSSIKDSGKYNGHHLDFKTARPENIVHMFEASNSQTILDGNNIAESRYIGDFQFNLNNTIYELVKYCRKDFPNLARAAGVDTNSGRIIKRNARSQEFYNEWCKLCNGAQSEKFSRMRFEYMFQSHFKPTFDKLHQEHNDFPHITIENYANPENFLFSALVMGTATQSPKSAFKIINKQIKLAKEEAKTKGTEVTPLDIYERVSNRKKELWGFAKRYNAEKKLAADITAYFHSVSHSKVANVEKESPQAKPQTDKAQLLASVDTIIVAPAVVENITPPKNLLKNPVKLAPKHKMKKTVVMAKTPRSDTENTHTVVVRNDTIIQKVTRFFKLAKQQDSTKEFVSKELPSTETPMVERPPEETTKVVKQLASTNNKRAKITRIIEQKKKEVRSKVNIRNKARKNSNSKVVAYSYYSLNQVDNS